MSFFLLMTTFIKYMTNNWNVSLRDQKWFWTNLFEANANEINNKRSKNKVKFFVVVVVDHLRYKRITNKPFQLLIIITTKYIAFELLYVGWFVFFKKLRFIVCSLFNVHPAIRIFIFPCIWTKDTEETNNKKKTNYFWCLAW